MTKNCRQIIKAIRSQGPEDRYARYSIHELVRSTGLTEKVIVSACEQLQADGFMEITYLAIHTSLPVIDTVRLTELGANYGEVRRVSIQNYITEHWIDFLSLLVSATALALSVAAFFRD